jgi:hypothetical protein
MGVEAFEGRKGNAGAGIWMASLLGPGVCWVERPPGVPTPQGPLWQEGPLGPADYRSVLNLFLIKCSGWRTFPAVGGWECFSECFIRKIWFLCLQNICHLWNHGKERVCDEIGTPGGWFPNRRLLCGIFFWWFWPDWLSFGQSSECGTQLGECTGPLAVGTILAQFPVT